MFLETIRLLQTLPCLAEPGKIIVVGQPARSLEPVLPYLATLPGIIAYNPAAGTLTFRRPRGFLTLYTDKVYITQVEDVEEGLRLLEGLADAINATWVQREALTPVTTAQRAPRVLDVWALLPQTNCKQCGEATCMAFAFALLQQQRRLEECASLASDDTMADHRAALATML